MKLLPSRRTFYVHRPCTSLQCHFMQNHISRAHMCLAVTCHLHFWQNDGDLSLRYPRSLYTERETETDRQTGRQIDRQTDKPIDRMTDRVIKIQNYSILSSEKLNMWLNIYHITVYNSTYCIFKTNKQQLL